MKKTCQIISVKVEYCAQCPHEDRGVCLKHGKDLNIYNLWRNFPDWCKIGERKVIWVMDTNICHGQEAEIVDDSEHYQKGVYLYRCKICHCGFFAPKPELLKEWGHIYGEKMPICGLWEGFNR